MREKVKRTVNSASAQALRALTIVITTIAITLGLLYQNNKKQEKVSNNIEQIDGNTNIDWEEYPENIANYVTEGTDGYTYVDEQEKNKIWVKTLYSLLKNESKNSNLLFLYEKGDNTEQLLDESNYKQYEFKSETTNREAYNKIIKYKVAHFNDVCYMYFQSNVHEPNIELDELTKYQYNKLMIDKDYCGYDYLPEETYFEIPNFLIMNGNNESKEAYRNNSRAKKIKVTINEKEEYIFSLKDTNQIQIFDIGYKQNTIETPVNIEIEVLEAYKGEMINDIYISDIQFGINSNIPQGR